MSGSIQARINRGMGAGAASLGLPHWIYHPTDPLAPLSRRQSGIPAAFDVDPHFSHRKPAAYGQPIYYGLLDASRLVVGDYLVGQDGDTYFVGALEQDKPPLCVRCNAVLTVSRPAPSPAGGGYYGADQQADETPLMTGWPASVLQGLRGEPSATGLPGDTRMPWYTVLLPAFPGVELQQADRISDDLGRRMTISSAEQSQHGWRITAGLAAN